MWPSQLCRSTSRDSRNGNLIPHSQLSQLSLALAACRRTGGGCHPLLTPLCKGKLLSPHLPSFMPGSRGIFYFPRHGTARVTLHCTEQSTADHPKCAETPETTNGTFLMSGSQSLGEIWMRTAQWSGSGRNYSTYIYEYIWGQYTEVTIEPRVESRANFKKYEFKEKIKYRGQNGGMQKWAVIKYADGNVLQWSSKRIMKIQEWWGAMRAAVKTNIFLLEPKAVHPHKICVCPPLAPWYKAWLSLLTEWPTASWNYSLREGDTNFLRKGKPWCRSTIGVFCPAGTLDKHTNHLERISVGHSLEHTDFSYNIIVAKLH